MAQAEITASIWQTDQPEEEQEHINVVHGGENRFILVELPAPTNADLVEVSVKATGIPPFQLVAILRTLADGFEANAAIET